MPIQSKPDAYFLLLEPTPILLFIFFVIELLAFKNYTSAEKFLGQLVKSFHVGTCLVKLKSSGS